MKPRSNEELTSLRYGIELIQKDAENSSFLLKKYNDVLIDEEPTEMFNDLILSYLVYFEYCVQNVYIQLFVLLSFHLL